MTQFNIGSQQAGNITNIGGDATIGEQHGTYVPPDALQALGDLRAALRSPDIDPAVRREAETTVDGLESDLQRGEPASAASRFDRLVELLKGAGAAVTAGAALAEPLTRIAAWLGPLAGRALVLPW